MESSKPKKRFVAEILRDQGRMVGLPAGAAAVGGSDEILAAIAELRSFIAETVGHTPPAPAGAPSAPDLDHVQIKKELEALRDAIISTKREIAAVRHPAALSDRLELAADELDAVVQATEQATQTILQSAESLDEMAERIKQASKDAFLSHTAEEMRELIVKIFEASNFQDITGQRITKVVKTVQFIEERVNAMIAIWGKESFQEIEVLAPSAPAGDDKALLSGPQLGNEGVSQDDIDKLFQ